MDVGKALLVLVELHRTFICVNHVVSINDIVSATMQILYIIHGEDFCYALLLVPCGKVS